MQKRIYGGFSKSRVSFDLVIESADDILVRKEKRRIPLNYFLIFITNIIKIFAM